MKESIYNGDTFAHDGRTFRASLEADSFAGEPWEDDEGRGIVRKSTKAHWYRENNKRPGERPMNKPSRNEYQFYYDWAGTMRKARSDAWWLTDDAILEIAKGLKRQPTKGEIIAEAVRQDFEFCRGWINQDWEYLAVTVTLLDDDGEDTNYSDSLGWVESYKNYHVEMCHELAGNILATVADDEESARLVRIEEVRKARETIHALNRETLELLSAIKASGKDFAAPVCNALRQQVARLLDQRAEQFRTIREG